MHLTICKMRDNHKLTQIVQRKRNIKLYDHRGIGKKRYFDHKPTAKEIEKAEAIREFEGGPEEVWYVLDERTDDQIPVHWLDADGDICRKVQIMRELGGGL